VFQLHDMVIEVAVMIVVLTVVLLSASVLAAAVRDLLERRHARATKVRLRQRVWRDYVAACATAQAPTAAPVVAAPAEMSTRAALDKGASLSAGTAKA
jgi:hypothetical protein